MVATSRSRAAAALLLLLVLAPAARATIVADVTHLKGRRQNTLMGYGLVVGLNGTGDGDKYAASIRQLQSMLSKFEVPVRQDELKNTKNIAIVWVQVDLPDNGVREGDAVDVQISSVGAAKSLAGGTLIPTPLQGPGLDRIFAFASGPIRVTDAKKQPTTGLIPGGAILEEDIVHNYINENGAITLVIEDVHASHALAAIIAQSINEDQSEIGQVRRVAIPVGPKNVVVSIPPEYHANPAEFIGRVESLELLMPQGEGRIVINRRSRTIAIGEGVEIGPAIIAHGGMTIRTTIPPPAPTPDNPIIEEKHAVEIGSSPTGGTRLQDLVDRLNQLSVPAEDIIEIIENLHSTGKIRGKLIYKE